MQEAPLTLRLLPNKNKRVDDINSNRNLIAHAYYSRYKALERKLSFPPWLRGYLLSYTPLGEGIRFTVIYR